MLSQESKDNGEELTFTMLERYGAAAPAAQLNWSYGVIAKAFILMVVLIIGVSGCYSGPVDNSTPSRSNSTASPDLSSPATSHNNPASADEEFRRLQERRISARPSESGEIIAAFSEAEKKHPNDYRFPYERAKLSVKGIVSHHEAFSALFLAGGKAIDSGKAQEMLDTLMADKEGDFYKVSRGHHEWQVLVQALNNKDKTELKAQHH